MTEIIYHAVFAGGQRAFVITNEQNFLRPFTAVSVLSTVSVAS